MTHFLLNEQGLWCPSCGHLVVRAALDEDDDLADMGDCPECGYPDAEACADYHVGRDDEDCSNCAGEGVVYSCHEEYACVDPEGGCDACERRCDWCEGKG